MKKYIIALACMIILLTGCTYRQEVVERDTETDTIHMSTGADGIKRPELTQTLAVKGEDFANSIKRNLMEKYAIPEYKIKYYEPRYILDSYYDLDLIFNR